MIERTPCVCRNTGVLILWDSCRMTEVIHKKKDGNHGTIEALVAIILTPFM